MREVVFHSRRLHDLPEVAAGLVKAAGDSRLLAFYGEMGAGKTTLIRSICRTLGVNMEVTSPTFALVNEYPSTAGPVFHFDFYRINRISEALDFGIEEYFDSGSWCLMEWPGKIEELLPDAALRVHIHENADGSRTFRIEISD